MHRFIMRLNLNEAEIEKNSIMEKVRCMAPLRTYNAVLLQPVNAICRLTRFDKV